ncbi:MAG: hypothetical protein JXI33_03445 [Candidatus Aminicenantes bacterium]|nr:hypothetical protein [Candidatus Aminicenantes bacterium]
MKFVKLFLLVILVGLMGACPLDDLFNQTTYYYVITWPQCITRGWYCYSLPNYSNDQSYNSHVFMLRTKTYKFRTGDLLVVEAGMLEAPYDSCWYNNKVSVAIYKSTQSEGNIDYGGTCVASDSVYAINPAYATATAE